MQGSTFCGENLACVAWRFKRANQEGEVNSSDLADPMIMAIMTSQRTKRANAQPRPQGTLSTSRKYPGYDWSRD